MELLFARAVVCVWRAYHFLFKDAFEVKIQTETHHSMQHPGLGCDFS